jgi:hypothetical protein
MQKMCKSKTNTINSQFEHQFKKSNLLFISSKQFRFIKENIYQNTNLDFLKNRKQLILH